MANSTQTERTRRYRLKMKTELVEGRLKIEKQTETLVAFKLAREKDKATIAGLEIKVAAMGADSAMAEKLQRIIDERDVTIKGQEEFIDELQGKIAEMEEAMQRNY